MLIVRQYTTTLFFVPKLASYLSHLWQLVYNGRSR